MKNLISMTLLFTSLFLTASVFANIDKQDISQFEISANHHNLKQIVGKFEVLSSNKDKLQIYVPRFRASELSHLAPKARLVHQSIYNSGTQKDGRNSKAYKKYDEVVSIMQELAAKYPNLVSLNSYGKSVKGNNLYFLKISDNVSVDEQEPELLITAATHGDEIITTETLMRFIVNMIKNKDTDERIAKMIQDHELFFIPVVNPDGFTKRRRYTADGTDPNREYPYPEKPNKTSVQCIEKEIEFFNSRNFVASMDLHASGELIMYPWGFTKDSVPAADKQMFETLGKKMASANRYSVGQISKIIYVAPASSADYFYWKKGTISYGIELARSKAPMSWSIGKIVDQATSMMNIFIENF